MARIIEAAEGASGILAAGGAGELKVAETVAELVCHASRELHMKLIRCVTHSGFTARLISRYRPQLPIIAMTPEVATLRRMALIWGVLPLESQRPATAIDTLAGITEKEAIAGAAGGEREM